MLDPNTRLRSLSGERERRDKDRVAVGLLMNEYIDDRMHRAMAVNVSPTGLYLDRLFGSGARRLQLGRDERAVQLEFTLPETSENIWALAEVCFDQVQHTRNDLVVVHGTGVRFVAIAKKHERLITEFVHDRKRKNLEALLDRVRNRRRNDRRRVVRRAA